MNDPIESVTERARQRLNDIKNKNDTRYWAQRYIQDVTILLALIDILAKSRLPVTVDDVR